MYLSEKKNFNLYEEKREFVIIKEKNTQTCPEMATASI